MNISRIATIFALGAVLALGGCMVGPDYVQPEFPTTTVPDAWNTAATEGLAEGEAPLQTWWTVFDDEALTSLIERAASSNLSLREALWRIQETRASTRRSLRRAVSTGGLDRRREPQRRFQKWSPGWGRSRTKPSNPTISSTSVSAPRGRSMSGDVSGVRSRQPMPRSRSR